MRAVVGVTTALVLVGAAVQSSIEDRRTKTSDSKRLFSPLFGGDDSDAEQAVGDLEEVVSDHKAVHLGEYRVADLARFVDDEENSRLRERRLQVEPELKEIGNNGKPARLFPLQLCQGDCDSHGECQGSLRCFFRSGNEEVPGCLLGPGTRMGIDYCYDPNVDSGASKNLIIRGDNKEPSGAFPLGKCEGDCDSNQDCQGSLRCFKANSPRTVPGCTGTRLGSKDYCYDPNDGPGPTPAPKSVPPSPNSFRLKLYWKQGYQWQEETFERKWCLECCGSSCGNGDCIKLRRCDGGNTRWTFGSIGGDRYQIQVSNQNLCMTLEGRRRIRLRDCRGGDSRQHWRASRGRFTGDRFEIHPLTRNGCINQHHHPRNGEEIFVDTGCVLARKWDTGFWNTY